ncbi:MAG: TolC family protein [Flavobacteriaceae bacterium]|jgi:outer membrane protein TolC|nr:TolC family protein [Flavobacteriaceae bacterium]
MKVVYLFGLILPTVFFGYGQQKMSLNECYEGLKTNYPLAKQYVILERQKEAELLAIKSKTLPQLNLSAQVTYQSDVTEVPLPNVDIEYLNNDQYRATLTANQLIFNAGKISASQGLQNIISDRKKQEVEVNLYHLKQRVNQLYFSILLVEDQTKLLIVREKQLRIKLMEVTSGIDNGVLLPTSDKVIEAELLKVLQQTKEVTNNKSKLISSLSSLIGAAINIDTEFQKPLLSTVDSSDLNRPELGMFNLQKQEIGQKQKILSKSLLPELIGFATGGYGNPGLNMLKNDFSSYYIVGLKLHWNLLDWNENKRERQALDYSKELISNREEVFRLNTNIALNEHQNEIETLKSTIEIDQQLISLQQEVVNTSESQLNNGIVTASEYITALTKLYETENLLNKHKTKLELAKANYNTLKGNIK